MRTLFSKTVPTIFLLCSLWPVVASAQPATLRFSNYSTRQGLADNLVNDIIRDSFGFIWTYSIGGVSRFDGTEFKNYPFPFHGYDRNNLAVDAKGNLWATDGMDLYFFDRKQDRFLPIPLKNPGRKGLSFILNNSRDGLTWFRETDDLYQIEPESRSVRRKYGGLPHTDPGFNYLDDKGRFWFGHPNQIQAYFPAYDSVFIFPFEPFWAHRFIEAGEDQLWVSGYGTGLVLFDICEKRYQTSVNKNGHNIYYDLAICPEFGGDSLLWMNGRMYEGLQVFSKSQKKFLTTYLHNRLNDQSLADNLTYKVYVDHEGILWVCNAGGISMAHPRRQDVYRHFFPEEPGSFTPKRIDWVRHENPDETFVFFNTEELRYFHHGAYRKLDNAQPLGLWSKVYATIFAAFDQYGRLWISSATGLHRIDRDRATIAESIILSSAGEARTGPVVPDRFGNMWFLLNGRLVKWNMANRKMIEFPIVPGSESYFQEEDWLTQIRFDHQGKIWLSTQNTILCFDPSTSKILRRYTYENLPSLNRRPADIWDFILDNRGHIWLGLPSGLVQTDSISGNYELIFLPGKDSTAASSLLNLLVDRLGNIWASTYAGVYCYSPEKERYIAHLDEKNELSSNTVYRIDWVGDRMYAYHANGMMDIIDPEIALQPLPAPPVYITEVKLQDRSIPWDWADRNAAPLRLSYRNNVITFRYTAVDFAAPKKVTYQYKLEGFDNIWRDGGPVREATYTNLGGGHYTFRVRAINGDGVVSHREASMEIYIQPPYWATWWFRVPLVLIFIALMYSIFRYRELQRLEQEKLRLRIARDLHDEMGSTLSSISILSEAAMRQLQQDIDRARFGIIGIRARQVMESMSDIVWSVNPGNDSMENILQRMRDFSLELFEPQGISLHFHADDAIKTMNLPMELRKDFYLLFKEAVNNAAKYSNAEEVWISVKNINNKLHLEIRDNGRGFDPAAVQRGNGLSNMQRRAERLGGTLHIESAANAGTRVSFEMK